MATAPPTLVPRAPYFPMLLPDPPKPHPIPLPPRSHRPPGRLNSFRSLVTEMDDLSDEENDVDETWKESIRNRGFHFLHVIGRTLTLQEEKNDQAESDSDESSAHSGGQLSNVEDGENDSVQDLQDLDADLEDMDADQDNQGLDDGEDIGDDPGAA